MHNVPTMKAVFVNTGHKVVKRTQESFPATSSSGRAECARAIQWQSPFVVLLSLRRSSKVSTIFRRPSVSTQSGPTRHTGCSEDGVKSSPSRRMGMAAADGSQSALGATQQIGISAEHARQAVDRQRMSLPHRAPARRKVMNCRANVAAEGLTTGRPARNQIEDFPRIPRHHPSSRSFLTMTGNSPAGDAAANAQSRRQPKKRSRTDRETQVHNMPEGIKVSRSTRNSQVMGRRTRRGRWFLSG